MLIKKCSFSVAVISLLLAGCANQAPKPDSQPSAALPSATDLSFREFYKLPIGPLGLEPTSKLLSLKNKRVHLQGFMVKEDEPTAGIFMVSLVPVNIPDKEDGPSDYLPGATVFVHMPAEDVAETLAYRPGMWDLVGTLQLGAKEEGNGRNSYVRLLLDQAPVESQDEHKEVTSQR
jgi:hypothetical protein